MWGYFTGHGGCGGASGVLEGVVGDRSKQFYGGSSEVRQGAAGSAGGVVVDFNLRLQDRELAKQLRENRMATQEVGFNTQGYDAGFELPSETEVRENGYEVTHFQVSENGTEPLDSDDFWGNAFDEDVLEEALKVDLPPEGWYTGSSFSVTRRNNNFDGHPELCVNGRVRHASGPGTAIYLNLCPRKMYSEAGKVIFDYLKFKEALAAYVEDHGGALPGGSEEFEAYFENAALAFRLVRQTNGKGMKVMEVRTLKSAIDKGYITDTVVDDNIPF